jgi:hypothetical protein
LKVLPLWQISVGGWAKFGNELDQGVVELHFAFPSGPSDCGGGGGASLVETGDFSSGTSLKGAI